MRAMGAVLGALDDRGAAVVADEAGELLRTTPVVLS
jgi:hypothetical protein